MRPVLIFATLCFTLTLSQCRDDSSSPCTSNPVEDLPRLKQKIELYESTQSDMNVFQVRYKSNTVFMIVYCCPMCAVVPAFYDCAGNELTDIDLTKLGNQKLLWKLPTSACG